MDTKNLQLIDTSKRQLAEDRDVDADEERVFVAGMSNVLNDEKTAASPCAGALGLDALAHPRGDRHRCETISGYLRAAGIAVRGRGRPSESLPRVRYGTGRG